MNCINCSHMGVYLGASWDGGASLGALSCDKNHWEIGPGDKEPKQALRLNIAKAPTCPDFDRFTGEA